MLIVRLNVAKCTVIVELDYIRGGIMFSFFIRCVIVIASIVLFDQCCRTYRDGLFTQKRINYFA